MDTKDKPVGRVHKLQIAAFVPVALHARVAELAEKEDRSIAQIVRRAVEAELERQAA